MKKHDTPFDLDSYRYKYELIQILLVVLEMLIYSQCFFHSPIIKCTSRCWHSGMRVFSEY